MEGVQDDIILCANRNHINVVRKIGSVSKAIATVRKCVKQKFIVGKFKPIDKPGTY